MIAVFQAAPFLETFVEDPPSQPPASFSIDQIKEDVNRKIEKKMKKAKPQ